MANVTIIGGHGKVALLAEPKLVEAGHTVRALIRSKDQVADIESTGAQAVVFDIENASTTQIEDLLKDTKTDVLVWSAGAGGGNRSRTFAVDQDAAIRSIEAATHVGLKRYIMVSYLGAGTGHVVAEDNGFYAYETAKAVADAYLRDSDLDYTILGPGTLTLEPSKGIEVNLAPDDSQTSRELVADVIVATVADDSTIGKAIPFSDGNAPVTSSLAQAPAKNNFKI